MYYCNVRSTAAIQGAGGLKGSQYTNIPKQK
jgi:hypothetical protein